MRKVWKITAALLLLAAAVTLTVLTVAGRSGHTVEAAEEDTPEQAYVSINNFLTNDLSGSAEAAALDSYIEKFMKRWEIKGGSLAVMKDGRLVYSKGYGWAD